MRQFEYWDLFLFLLIMIFLSSSRKLHFWLWQAYIVSSAIKYINHLRKKGWSWISFLRIKCYYSESLVSIVFELFILYLNSSANLVVWGTLRCSRIYFDVAAKFRFVWGILKLLGGLETNCCGIWISWELNASSFEFSSALGVLSLTMTFLLGLVSPII